jgi:hypothetical protein
MEGGKIAAPCGVPWFGVLSFRRWQPPKGNCSLPELDRCAAQHPRAQQELKCLSVLEIDLEFGIGVALLSRKALNQFAGSTPVASFVRAFLVYLPKSMHLCQSQRNEKHRYLCTLQNSLVVSVLAKEKKTCPIVTFESALTGPSPPTEPNPRPR